MFRHPTIVVSIAFIIAINAQRDYGQRINDYSYVDFSPYVVSITNGTLNCTGTIISERHILTAKQCVDNDESNYRVRSASNFRDYDGLEHQVKYANRSDDYDVAVLTLQEPLVLDGTWAAPVVLMDNNYTKFETHQRSLVIGWGMTPQENANGLRREATVELRPWIECSVPFGGMKVHEICTGYREGRPDVCYGDLGSPLLIDDELTPLSVIHHQRFTQVGVLSWNRDCGETNSTNVYTNVGWVRWWIDGILKQSV